MKAGLSSGDDVTSFRGGVRLRRGSQGSLDLVMKELNAGFQFQLFGFESGKLGDQSLRSALPGLPEGMNLGNHQQRWRYGLGHKFTLALAHARVNPCASMSVIQDSMKEGVGSHAV